MKWKQKEFRLPDGISNVDRFLILNAKRKRLYDNLRDH